VKVASTNTKKDLSFLEANYLPSDPFALVFLNVQSDHTFHPEVPRRLFQLAAFTVVADGGANTFIRKVGYPDVVCGDLDSIEDCIKEECESNGVEVRKIYDQNQHDFQKALNCALEKNFKRIIVWGSLTGRFDQVIAITNTLYSNLERADIYFVSLENVLTCLPAGKHSLTVGDSILRAKYCGWYPLGGVVKIQSTTGFRWNVTDWKTEFGGMVSSSNEVCEAQLSMENDKPLLCSFSWEKIMITPKL